MTLTITAEQRDALYEQIEIQLSGIDGVWLALKAGDLETTQRLAREHSDYLRLVLDDLGFGAGTGQSVELHSPPDLLRRVFANLRSLAEGQRTVEEAERSEAEKSGVQNHLVLRTCKSLLEALDPR